MPPMEVQGMKLHRGLWDDKWLRPLVPKTTAPGPTNFFDLKSFIRPESGHRAVAGHESNHKHNQVDQSLMQGGGTRWNPTQEQIGILEMLYRSGMRTPNAQQIENITGRLSAYGKIEGKNVFYWFQNHKARERQKQKRSSLGLSHSPRTPTSPLTTSLLLSPASGVEEESSDGGPCKRKCINSWGMDQCLEEVMNKSCTSDEEEEEEDEAENRTLKLFPLHPEGRYRRRID